MQLDDHAIREEFFPRMPEWETEDLACVNKYFDLELDRHENYWQEIGGNNARNAIHGLLSVGLVLLQKLFKAKDGEECKHTMLQISPVDLDLNEMFFSCQVPCKW